MRLEYSVRTALFYLENSVVNVILSTQLSGSKKCSLGGGMLPEEYGSPELTAVREIGEEGFRNNLAHPLLAHFATRLTRLPDQLDSHPAHWFTLPITKEESKVLRPGSDVAKIDWVPAAEVPSQLTYLEWKIYWDTVLKDAIYSVAKSTIH